MERTTFSATTDATAAGRRIGIKAAVAASCVFASLLLGGCSDMGGQSGPSGSKAPGTTKLVRSPIVSTIDTEVHPLTVNTVSVYPMETLVGELHAVDKETLDRATADLISKMQVATSLQLLNLDPTKDAQGAIAKTAALAMPLRERALRSAKAADAQGVLYGVISKFNDAEGSGLGETGKSEVSFQVFLADVRSGRDVWKANFTDSNQPLSENLFRLGNVAKQGFKYKSAGQILDEGLGLAASDLEKARKRQS